MKIAFVGKGGSGKTTLTALFARHLAAEGRTVLALDADINQNLATALGEDVDEAALAPTLGEHLDQVKEYLRGDNSRISSAAASSSSASRRRYGRSGCTGSTWTTPPTTRWRCRWWQQGRRRVRRGVPARSCWCEPARLCRNVPACAGRGAGSRRPDRRVGTGEPGRAGRDALHRGFHTRETGSVHPPGRAVSSAQRYGVGHGYRGQVRERYRKAEASGDYLALPSAVLFELWYGVAKSSHVPENTDRLRILRHRSSCLNVGPGELTRPNRSFTAFPATPSGCRSPCKIVNLEDRHHTTRQTPYL
jgi:CobQ/CobB/MinD/ParA nucleotide binding domain